MGEKCQIMSISKPPNRTSFSVLRTFHSFPPFFLFSPPSEDFHKIEALSRLTHPKNLKNSAKTNQRQSSSTHKRVHHTPATMVTSSNNSIKVKPPAVTMAARQTPVPVSLRKVDLGSSLGTDLFHQELNLLDPHLLPLDGDLGLQVQ